MALTTGVFSRGLEAAAFKNLSAKNLTQLHKKHEGDFL
jgi:hypothetical protein